MKLTEFENPLTGKRDNIFDLGGLWSKVLGVVMLFIVFAAGQNLTNLVGSKLPIDTAVDPIFKAAPVGTSKIVL
jgi:hypothetical protein